jgi:uncharacterized LabA/DUF88 family protein
MTTLQQNPPKIALKTKETLYVLGVLAGTAFTVISQQAAFTSISFLGLLLMQRTNQHRLTLAQKQQQQQIITVVQQSLSSLTTQIQHLEIQINQTELSSKNYLTKTHLTPIHNKLHQLQHENKVFKLKQLKDLTQQINTLQHQFEQLTHQTENLQASQHKLEQQLLQTQPSSQAKPTPKHPQQNHRVAIFIDSANIYHSAIQLGHEPPDYTHFLSFLKGQSSSCQAFFYTGVDPTNPHQKRLLRLQSLGYKIVSKEIIKRADGSCKANLDVELALDLVELANTYDTAILVSGDGDFVPAVERIQRLGKRVEVVSYRATTSQKLMQLADNYFDLGTWTGFRQKDLTAIRLLSPVA